MPFVVVEKNPHLVERLARSDNMYVEGDATDDETLIAGGFQQ